MTKSELQKTREHLRELTRLNEAAINCDWKVEEFKTILEKGTDLSPSEGYWKTKLAMQQDSFNKIMADYEAKLQDLNIIGAAPEHIEGTIKVLEQMERDENDFADMSKEDIKEVERGG